jgi:Fe-S cluster biogenesis protein NfuA
VKWFGSKSPEDAPPAQGDPVRVAEVQEALESLRPMLQADGGDVRLLEVVDDEVRLQLVGACEGCGMSFYTVRQGIEPELRRRLPWVRRISAE